MTYQVGVNRRSEKALADISSDDRRRILSAIKDLKNNPRPSGCKKLAGREGWRIRSQNYRVIYHVDDAQKMVLVVDIGHRKDIYR